MRLLLMAFLAIKVCAAYGESDIPPFVVRADTDNSATLEVFGKPILRQQSSDAIDLSEQGNEESECRPYGRRSNAGGSANSKVTQTSPNAVSITLSASSIAVGGHYRQCATCLAKNCIGLMGNDTKGESNVLSHVRLKLEANAQYPRTDFRLQIRSSSNGLTPQVRLLDGNSNQIAITTEGKPYAIITANAGAVYYLEASLVASTTNEGGCCDEKKAGTSRIDVEWFKAPVLYAARHYEPFIVGGVQTSNFPEVGALVLDGDLLCTATIIGLRTLLTAAHCLEGYWSQKDKIQFILGPNINQPSVPPFGIVNWDYPKGSPAGFRFNPSTYEDDVGVVYVDRLLNVTPVRLPGGQPVPWADIVSHNTSLTFVGYGYDKINGNPEGIGVKREASWSISEVQNRQVSFSVPKRNTCKGDSGGPAFFYDATNPDNKVRVQVAVTSGGNFPDCTYGVEMRVDSYEPWLTGRIH